MFDITREPLNVAVSVHKTETLLAQNFGLPQYSFPKIKIVIWKCLNKVLIKPHVSVLNMKKILGHFSFENSIQSGKKSWN